MRTNAFLVGAAALLSMILGTALSHFFPGEPLARALVMAILGLEFGKWMARRRYARIDALAARRTAELRRAVRPERN